MQGLISVLSYGSHRLLSCYLLEIGLIYCSVLVASYFSKVAKEKVFISLIIFFPFIVLPVACRHFVSRAPLKQSFRVMFALRYCKIAANAVFDNKFWLRRLKTVLLNIAQVYFKAWYLRTTCEKECRSIYSCG